ncbi:MAG: GAF domain-containing protein [Myxococcales bacterium]|nr:GAF domain-containing protein [Myxococcales bacterium]
MSDEKETDSAASGPSSAGDSSGVLEGVQEREAFVRTFLRKGMEFTEDLLRENESLRADLDRLRVENGRLRTQVASDEAIRDLLRTVEGLEEERTRLLERSSELEASRRQQVDLYGEIEREMNDLANLYIASHHLHTSLSVSSVVQHLRDMVHQLVGAECFVIYLVDADGLRARPIAQAELDPSTLEPIVLDGHPLGDACLTGLPRIRESNLDAGSLDDPLAIIPLLADGKAVGVVSIISLLEQKGDWAEVDRALFRLLGAQAGTALIAANLYSAVPSPGEALADLGQKLDVSALNNPEGAK